MVFVTLLNGKRLKLFFHFLTQVAKIGKQKRQEVSIRDKKASRRPKHLGREAPTLFLKEEALTALGANTPRSEWKDEEYLADLPIAPSGNNIKYAF